MSRVRVNAYTAAHASTFVATGMLRGLKQVIVGAGLRPSRLAEQWPTLEAGVATWLKSGHLRRLTLEVWDPARLDGLVQRFDFSIDYGYYSDGDGDLWLDPETARQAIRKAGSFPSACSYDIKILTAPGEPYVEGFESCTYRSTSGMRERSVGTAIGGGALGAALSYWGRT
ncbi:MAG: HORMA domain containing protein [Acidimicrobiales bacterium]